MTAARLLLEIHRRAAAAPQNVPRGAALKRAVRDVLQLGDGDELDIGLLEALWRISDGAAGAARALRAAVVRPARN